MFRTVTATFALMLLTSVAPAHAADRDKAVVDDTVTTPGSTALATDVDWSLPPVRFGAESRGALLPSLYVSLAALNAFDAYSTTKGVAGGAVEGNPMMRAVAGRPAALWAVKGGATAGAVYLAERLWKNDHKVGAVVVMLATNGMMATVAARNSSVMRQQTR